MRLNNHFLFKFKPQFEQKREPFFETDLQVGQIKD